MSIPWWISGIRQKDKSEFREEEYMKRVQLQELSFDTRNEVIAFLKSLWNQESVDCPLCGGKLELLHKKAKKSDCDWQCKNCDKTFKTIYLLNEINEQMPD